MTISDATAKRNAAVLGTAMGLAGANASVVFATGALVGQAIGPSPAWATLPLSAFVLGTAIATMPAAFLMRAIGRRKAYQLGAGLGVLAGVLAAYSVREALFGLFVVATTLCGFYHAFVSSYRFGAADQASADFRAKAISWVLLGGVASAVVGPQLVIATKDLTPPFQFQASYIGQAGFALLSIVVLALFRDAPPVTAGDGPAARTLREILRPARLKVAILCGAIAQSLMNLIMTAAPLAMIGCGLTATDSTLAIQWHILGMFLPGFFTGNLIQRFGVYKVMLVGYALLAACGIVALGGLAVANFNAALILLGIGWNFAFVGASSLVVEGQVASERNKLQGFNDLVVFLTTAAASLLSGKVLAAFGWATLNVALFPIIVLALAMVAWLWREARAPRPV